MVRALTNPARLRFTSIVHHLEMIGLRSVPIIALISFLVGGIVAQQGIFQLNTFGAPLLVVDLVGILTLRELALLLTSIMIAGRSGSSITAELGSMKMREEIDALHVIGLDPMEVLILPRVLALLISMPILTFISEMSALFGAGVVAFLYGGISPEVFLFRLQNALSFNTFMVGMIKAPFMALGDRPHRHHGGHGGRRLRRIARTPDHLIGRQVDLHGDRGRRHLRDVLRGDQLLMAEIRP